MFEADEHRIAVHEAGHVVVGHVEGVPIKGVTLDAEEAEEGFGGVWFPKPTEMTEEDLVSRGRVAWAGSVAESLVFDSALQTSWRADVMLVFELSDEHGQEVGPFYVRDEVKEAARQVLNANRNALDEVTRLLLRHGTVDGEQLTTILDEVVS
ncbi:ATP-dependent Zn protease [Salinibacter ruber]|uniref:hypothetical protein n=1 Tax=Salinibacter ruber TaxID=146919 RepID=UPI002167A397|nr:hypothetical protein [Salinibacter ruber]MCS4191703.1 ATP-dependent Zn protease [Salinibacter ruber]